MGMIALPTSSEMSRAVRTRDAEYDGLFFTAVRTTGIFCRPSCTARKPKPANVEFFPTAGEALLAGYRPCKRCRPMDTDGRPPDWVRKLLARVESDPTGRFRDGHLRSLGIDPARARRFFNRHYGMTFQAFQRHRRMGLALAEVRRGTGMTGVGVRYGYESESGFRDAFQKLFGTSPGRAQTKDCIVVTWLTSPVGPLLAAATDVGVCMLEFADRRGLETQVKAMRRRLNRVIVPGMNAQLEQLGAELREYFDGKRKEFKVTLFVSGTPFQELVWEQLRRIPYGQTCSYDRIARELGRPSAHRAVARANGDNRLAILIPCHRVIRADGSLSGYGGGVWRKQFLLVLEKGGPKSLPLPTHHG